VPKFVDRIVRRDQIEEEPDGWEAEPGPQESDVPPPSAPDSPNIGEHITSVLEAAEAAATAIRAEALAEAERDAERIKREAEAEVEGARRDAASAAEEANALRTEAERASFETRSRADAYAEQKRKEADAEVAQLVVRARQDADEQLSGTHERQRALDRSVALTEERLRKLTSGLRELATRLEALVDSDGAATNRPADEQRQGTSLEETLRPTVAPRTPDESPT
jgi:chromosome segregation ATPase